MENPPEQMELMACLERPEGRLIEVEFNLDRRAIIEIVGVPISERLPWDHVLWSECLLRMRPWQDCEGVQAIIGKYCGHLYSRILGQIQGLRYPKMKHMQRINFRETPFNIDHELFGVPMGHLLAFSYFRDFRHMQTMTINKLDLDLTRELIDRRIGAGVLMEDIDAEIYERRMHIGMGGVCGSVSGATVFRREYIKEKQRKEAGKLRLV